MLSPKSIDLMLNPRVLNIPSSTSFFLSSIKRLFKLLSENHMTFTCPAKRFHPGFGWMLKLVNINNFFSISLVPGPQQQSTVLSPAVKCIPWVETLYQEQVLPCEVPCNWLMKFYGRLLLNGKEGYTYFSQPSTFVLLIWKF